MAILLLDVFLDAIMRLSASRTRLAAIKQYSHIAIYTINMNKQVKLSKRLFGMPDADTNCCIVLLLLDVFLDAIMRLSASRNTFSNNKTI